MEDNEKVHLDIVNRINLFKNLLKEFEHYFYKKREADKDLKLTVDIQEILNDLMKTVNLSKLTINNIKTKFSEVIKYPSYRTLSYKKTDLCPFYFNQISFNTCKKFNKYKNESLEVMQLLKENIQKELFKNISLSVRNMNKYQEKSLSDNKKIILSLSNKNFGRGLQLDSKKGVGINNFIKKLKHHSKFQVKEDNFKANFNILNNEFIKKSLQKIENFGFIQQQNDLSEIANNMKLKQKSFRNFELDLVESVKNTTNLITEVNRTREVFRDTKYKSEKKKNKLEKNHKLKKSYYVDRNNITNCNVDIRDKIKYKLINDSSPKGLIDKSTSVNFIQTNQVTNNTNYNHLIKRNEKTIFLRSNIVKEYN